MNHSDTHNKQQQNIQKQKSQKQNTTRLYEELHTQHNHKKPRKTKPTNKHNIQKQQQRPHLCNSASKGRQAQVNTETQTANGTQIPLLEHDRWGHHLSIKPQNTIRILIQSIGGIGTHHCRAVKLAALHELMMENQVDIVTLMKCNMVWSKVDHALWPQEQTKFWWENAHWSITHNCQDPNAAKYRPGGTSLVVVNQLAHRTQRPGDDKTGLGRWCWAHLKGKHNHHLQVILAYCPCPSLGPLSTYQQQVCHWSSKRLNCCP